jgi:hypothetical protein
MVIPLRFLNNLLQKLQKLKKLFFGLEFQFLVDVFSVGFNRIKTQVERLRYLLGRKLGFSVRGRA